MATKQDWKETGRDLGHAFKGLGKTLIRTAKTGVDKVSDWADGKDDDKKLDVDVEVADTMTTDATTEATSEE